uniref:Uncharacterized protein n=1 Tax=viral metagenome TaxID=1070528 RepID=A0A6M3M0Z6_9ZZZZ
MKLIVSQPYRQNGNLIGYLMVKTPENGEYSGKFLSVKQFNEIASNEMPTEKQEEKTWKGNTRKRKQ